MTNKKLGLLLLPLVPLSAFGIVEIAGRIVTPEQPTVAVVERPVVLTPAPVAPAPVAPAPVAPAMPPGATASR